MVVVVLEKCLPALRGDLTKWLVEVSPGVYVGQLSARVRDLLWERICAASANGRATMAFSKRGEQRFDVRTHNCERRPVDFDGLTLMVQPSAEAVRASNPARTGYSDASRSTAAKKAQSRRKRVPDEYVVVDIETTGLDASADEVIEIAAVRYVGGKETGRFQTLVKPTASLPSEITSLTGITAGDLSDAPAFGDVADDFLDFIGADPLVMHNATFDEEFLNAALEAAGFDSLDSETVDTLAMARKRIPGLPHYRLVDLCRYLDLDNRITHRAMDDCLATADLFAKLIGM